MKNDKFVSHPHESALTRRMWDNTDTHRVSWGQTSTREVSFCNIASEHPIHSEQRGLNNICNIWKVHQMTKTKIIFAYIATSQNCGRSNRSRPAFCPWAVRSPASICPQANCGSIARFGRP